MEPTVDARIEDCRLAKARDAHSRPRGVAPI
jgi:hypothetical protein